MSAAALSTWNRLRSSAVGRWLFSRAICFKAPYFATIRPQFLRLEPGTCEVALRKRRAVLNHIGTVHAIAMCNLAELAGGLVTEVTLPDTHRWIPKGMRVDYLTVAKTDLVATARCMLPSALADLQTLEVPVDVLDASGNPVFRARIEMHLSKRKPSVARDSRRS